MAVLLIFVSLVFVGDLVAVGLASLVEQFSKSAGLLVFLALFVGVFVVAWIAAVHITERYFTQTR